MENDLDIPPFKISPKNPSETLLAFRSAENAWRTKFPGYFEKASEKLYRIIGQMKAEMTAEYMPNEKTALIAPAVSYINENYTSEAISISHLSELCGVSEVYFRKIFKNVYGSSPLKYINSLKLSRARDLIHSGLYSVKDAAFMSGFFDDSYFSREFKKFYKILCLYLYFIIFYKICFYTYFDTIYFLATKSSAISTAPPAAPLFVLCDKPTNL